MAGLVPSIHESHDQRCSWIAGTPRFALRPAMTSLGIPTDLSSPQAFYAFTFRAGRVKLPAPPSNGVKLGASAGRASLRIDAGDQPPAFSR